MDLRKQKNTIEFSIEKALKYNLIFYSKLPYETRVFLLPFVHWELESDLFGGVKCNFELIFIKKRS